MNKLPASTGWLWLKQAFGLFRKQPGLLTMLFFANMMLTMLVSMLPIVGPLLMVVLFPSFSMAMMMSYHLIMRGERATPAVLSTGFQQPALKALCKLGLVYLAVFIVPVLIGLSTMDPNLLPTKQQPMTAESMRDFANAAMPSMLLISGLHMLGHMLLMFAVPLTFWKKMPLGKAIFYSVFGVWGAWKPVLVMVLAWLGMFMLAGNILALILGNTRLAPMMFLILLFSLVLHCACYCAYRQIFGDPDAPPEAKVSLDKT